MLQEEQLAEMIERRYSDIRITVSDLKNPSRKFLHQYFVKFFEEFGADVSVLIEPSSEQLQAVEYPAAFKGALQVMNYFGAVKYILQYIAGDFKISITDLTEPNPNKAKVLIKCTEEFYKYANLKASNLIIPLETKMMQKKAYCNYLLQEVESRKEDINKWASEVAQMQIHIEQLNEQIAAQDVELRELQMQNMKLEEGNKDLEAEVIQCKVTLDEVETAKAQLEETLRDLEFKVSQLPTEATLAAVTEKRMKLEEEVALTIKRVEEKSSRIADAENKIKLWQDISFRLDEVVALLQEHQSKKAKLEALEKQQSLEQEKQEAEEEKCRKLRAKIAQLAEMKAARRAQWLERKTLLEKRIEEERRKNEILRKEKEEEQKTLMEIEDCILKNDEELLLLKNENKRVCRYYDEQFMKLQKEHEEVLLRLTGKQFNVGKRE